MNKQCHLLHDWHHIPGYQGICERVKQCSRCLAVSVREKSGYMIGFSQWEIKREQQEVAELRTYHRRELIPKGPWVTLVHSGFSPGAKKVGFEYDSTTGQASIERIDE